jgi:hypothetical protein
MTGEAPADRAGLTGPRGAVRERHISVPEMPYFDGRPVSRFLSDFGVRKLSKYRCQGVSAVSQLSLK